MHQLRFLGLSPILFAMFRNDPPGGDDGGGAGGGNTPPAGGGAGAGTGNTPPAGKQDDPPSDDDEDKSKKFDASYVKQLRDEAAKHRKEKAAVEAKLKAFEDAQLTEQQKKDRDFEDLRKQNTELAAKARQADVMAAASRKGAKYADLVALKIPSDTEPADYDKAIADIKKDYPELFGTATPRGSANAGAGTGNNAGSKNANQQANDWLRRQAGRNVLDLS